MRHEGKLWPRQYSHTQRSNGKRGGGTIQPLGLDSTEEAAQMWKLQVLPEGQEQLAGDAVSNI